MMLLRATLESLRRKPVRLVGTLATYVITLSCMLALISILVSTTRNYGPAYLLEGVDAAVRVDAVAAFDFDEALVPTGLDMRISNDQLATIQHLEGVESAEGYVVQPVSLMAADGSSIPMTGLRGSAWNLETLHLVEGSLPSSPSEVALPVSMANERGVEPGDQVVVSSDAGPETMRLSGTFAGPKQADVLVLMTTSEFDDAGYQFVALNLVDPSASGQVSDEMASLREKHPLEIADGEELARFDPLSDVAQIIDFGALLGVMAGFMGFVAIFVILSTTGFSIQQRASQIAVERAIGYTPRQVRLSVLFETLLVAAAGSLIGLLLAFPIASLSVAIAKSRGILPDHFRGGVDPLVASIMIPSMALIVMLVSWWASRRARGISPIAAMRDARAPQDKVGIWRGLWGGLLIGAGGVAVAISAAIPPLLAMVFSLFIILFVVWGISLIGPWVVRAGARLAAPFLTFTDPAIGRLAIRNTSSMAGRVASGVTPVMMGTGFLIMMFLFTATSQQGTVEVSRNRERADYFVVAPAGFLPKDTAARLNDIDGVKAITASSSIELFLPAASEDDTPMVFDGVVIDDNAFGNAVELQVQNGKLGDWQPGTIIVSDFFSFDSNLKMGRTEEIGMPDGSLRSFNVVAIADNMIGAGDVYVHQEDMVDFENSMTINRLAITLNEGADPGQLVTEIAALQQEGYPLILVSQGEYVGAIEQSMSSDAWATYLIVGSAAALGMIASINTLAMTTLDRSREFSLMRLIGATPHHVFAMAWREGILVGVFGVGGGIVLALMSALSVSMALVGNASAVRAPVLPVLVASGLAFAICVAAVATPASLALRKDAMDEIGTKE